MNTLNRVVIFGATSAIAEHTARILVARGASLYCVGRTPDKLSALLADLKVRAGAGQRIEGASADLTDSHGHRRLIEQAEAAIGDFDAVLIAHGRLPDQKACEADPTLAREEIEINAISVIGLLTLLANRFEGRQSGTIAVISSVAGDRGRQSNYVYGAAKGMVSLFTEGLHNRLLRSNVDVVTIKPGFVDTPMTENFQKGGALWSSPVTIANGIVAAMKSGSGVVYLPKYWYLIMAIIKHIPTWFFKRLSL